MSQNVFPGGCNNEIMLTYTDKNTLRYTTGYIPKHLRAI